MVPFPKGKEHIRTNHKKQIVLRVGLPEILDSVGRVASAYTLKFQIADRCCRNRSKSNLAHLQPGFRRRTVFGKIFVGRQIIRNDQEKIRLEKFCRRLRTTDMAEMRRIETAAVDGNFHLALPRV